MEFNSLTTIKKNSCLSLMPIWLSCAPIQSYFILANQLVKSAVHHNPQQVVITLQRGQCLGSCPVYKLTIYGTGKVVYEGKENVSSVGKKEFAISQDRVRQLIAEFDKVQFFLLKNDYEGGPADAPSTIKSINIDGKTKTIHHYGASPNAPEALTKLENKIDSIVGISH